MYRPRNLAHQPGPVPIITVFGIKDKLQCPHPVHTAAILGFCKIKLAIHSWDIYKNLFFFWKAD